MPTVTTVDTVTAAKNLVRSGKVDAALVPGGRTRR